jgi:hypothetical protein
MPKKSWNERTGPIIATSDPDQDWEAVFAEVRAQGIDPDNARFVLVDKDPQLAVIQTMAAGMFRAS